MQNFKEYKTTNELVDLDQIVKEMMDDKNLKFEVKNEEGRWIKCVE